MAEIKSGLEVSATPYILGRTSKEYDRLRRQAERLEPFTRAIFDRIDLKPGMRCLDVGCGPGEVMRLMAQKVGPSGSVVGMDIDGHLGRETLAILRASALSEFSFIEGNIETLEELGDQQFDLTFARLVLIHLADPVSALRKMFRWTKPGGSLVVQDYDMRTLDFFPAHEPWVEARRVLLSAIKRTGRDVHIGSKLPWLFAEAGIGSPDGTEIAGHFLSPEKANFFLREAYRSVLPRAIELGITSEKRSKAVLEQLEKPPDGYHAAVSSLMMSAWKQKRH